MNPSMVLRVLRQKTALLPDVAANPDADWSAELTEVLKGVEALDGWLTGGGHLPDGWNAARRH